MRETLKWKRRETWRVEETMKWEERGMENKEKRGEATCQQENAIAVECLFLFQYTKGLKWIEHVLEQTPYGET
ncbi:hypothetical protein VNO80_16008 [Phaseolus coccineus]|uniref:Uncharacterized protein n=1 Tax=Phaseolus coccineus TaxID=3886 RepID=A0AAN9R7I3_PHACN